MKMAKAPFSCFISRDVSWLSFNERVLSEAGDRTVPLLERLKFLSIYYSNLDEFFMVRVGSLIHRSLYMPGYKDEKTGRGAEDELKQLYGIVASQQKMAQLIYDKLMLDLNAEGIVKVDFKHLSKTEEIMTKKMFAEYKDLLSPRIIDEQHAVPFLSDRESFCVVSLNKNGKEKYGIVSLYRLPKYASFESENGKQKIVVMSELVNHYIQALFKKYTVKKKYTIRVTRNADIFFEDYDKGSKDSRFGMKKLLKQRKRSTPVRIQVYGKPSDEFINYLKEAFKVQSKQIFVSQVPFDLNFAKEIGQIPKLSYKSAKPIKNVHLQKGEFFPYLQNNDMLLSFPYQSIKPFIDLVYEAAEDDSVESIYITLYRLAASSRLAAALAYAADKGKEVVCLLELRARFDEQNNIDYSEVLEDAGCQIIYGLEDMKVHSKLMLIKRRMQDGTASYITQLGTGNYNEVTSEQYTDLSFITSNYEVGVDAEKTFQSLRLGEAPEDVEHIVLAPNGFKKRLLAALDREKEKGSNGRVSIKVNSLNDMDVMEKFIECSKAGVKIELFIRGICCLKPGIAGVTENITVKSVIGRYLEHSRIYIFGTGNERRVFIGSGDLLNRNTERRVEAFIEIKSKESEEQVLEVMHAFREDINNSWIMQPDGTYQKMPTAAGKDSFEYLREYFAKKEITTSGPQRDNIFDKISKLFNRAGKASQ